MSPTAMNVPISLVLHRTSIRLRRRDTHCMTGLQISQCLRHVLRCLGNVAHVGTRNRIDSTSVLKYAVTIDDEHVWRGLGSIFVADFTGRVEQVVGLLRTGLGDDLLRSSTIQVTLLACSA